MSEPLTKNARWIVFWAKYRGADDSAQIFKPKSTVFNTGRHSYNKPTLLAINESLDFSKDIVLESKVYEVDVAVAPYAKQHEFVTQIATKYFKQQGAELS